MDSPVQTIQRFRQTLLDAVASLKATRSGAQLHLLYVPELVDPLSLVEDAVRDMALIRPPLNVVSAAPDKDKLPRVITLDCRRVAAYFLETSPDIDDPLFESSITQAHAETCLQQKHDAELQNDERELSELSIGGWILSCEPASTIALRIHKFAHLILSNEQRYWVRWSNPVYLSALWPAMTAAQRWALLGDAVWLAFDATGQLRHYSATEVEIAHKASDTVNPLYAVRCLSREQSLTVKNVPLVRDLLPRWQSLCEERGERLPIDAERQLHAHVQAAQQCRLDAESVAIYALTAVQLRPGATQDEDWLGMVRRAGANALPLSDLMGRLPDEFWERWSALDQEEDD